MLPIDVQSSCIGGGLPIPRPIAGRVLHKPGCSLSVAHPPRSRPDRKAPQHRQAARQSSAYRDVFLSTAVGNRDRLRCIDVAAALPHATHQPLFLISAGGRVGDHLPVSTTSLCPIFTSHSALPRHATRGEPGPVRGPGLIDSHRHSSQCRERSERNWQQRTIVICVAGPGEGNTHQPPIGINPRCLFVDNHRQY